LRPRDRGQTPWTLKITPLFEAAFDKLCEVHPRHELLEVLDVFELGACRDPRATGEPHVSVSGLWVYEIPYVARLPLLAIMFTIDDDLGLVILWNVTALAPPT
jgi:hypothetical protein